MKNIYIMISLAITFSCVSSLKPDLTPEEKNFLSKVRYIISKDERKNFLSLPSSERDSFIEEFWKRRDPIPETEVNEFKEEYFKRIEGADRLFGKGGWLQDRGMVYVSLGPPTERYTYPAGRYQGDLPTEIWFYGFFPVVFIDYYWNGDYKLTPLSARQIAEINKAQSFTAPKFEISEIAIDFEFELKNDILQIKIPYKSIALNKKGSIFYTTLNISLIIKDDKGDEVLRRSQNFDLTLTLDNVKKIQSPFHVINFEIKLDKGSYNIEVLLKNISNNSSKKKEKKIFVE